MLLINGPTQKLEKSIRLKTQRMDNEIAVLYILLYGEKKYFQAFVFRLFKISKPLGREVSSKVNANIPSTM